MTSSSRSTTSTLPSLTPQEYKSLLNSPTSVDTELRTRLELAAKQLENNSKKGINSIITLQELLLGPEDALKQAIQAITVSENSILNTEKSLARLQKDLKSSDQLIGTLAEKLKLFSKSIQTIQFPVEEEKKVAKS